MLGWAEFCGLRIAVDPGVFVPRRRTEFLVGRAAALARQRAGTAGEPVVVVDLCCGSGALGAALAAAVGPRRAARRRHRPGGRPAAPAATSAPVGGRVYHGDLFEPLPAALRGRVDILVANVPYVPTEAIGLMPAEARLHEARAALDGGADGLDVLRRVARPGAASWLAPGGHLLIETSERQAPEATRILRSNGLRPQLASSDELDSTIVIGTRPGGG